MLLFIYSFLPKYEFICLCLWCKAISLSINHVQREERVYSTKRGAVRGEGEQYEGKMCSTRGRCAVRDKSHPNYKERV